MFTWFKKRFLESPADQTHLNRERFLAENMAQEKPWAMFEIVDFPDDGQIKVEFNWNDAFIKRITALGFQAENEQDAVQLFFYASQMKPRDLAELGGDEAAQPDNHPTLSQPMNRVVR